MSLCFSSLDLKRKGIGNLFSAQIVQMGCDSTNNAGNKAVAIVALCFSSGVCAAEKEALQGMFRIYINFLYRQCCQTGGFPPK